MKKFCNFPTVETKINVAYDYTNMPEVLNIIYNNLQIHR